MSNVIWMEVTADKYELPVRICDSAKELAWYTGVRPATIASEASRQKRGLLKRARYVKVVIDDTEDVDTRDAEATAL